MKKYNLKKGFVALGLAGVMVVSAACSRNEDKSNNLDNSSNNTIGNTVLSNENNELDTFVDTEEIKTKANDLLVLDSDYICNSSINANSIKLSNLPKYRLIKFEEKSDENFAWYEDISNNATISIWSKLTLDQDGEFNSLGYAEYKEKNNVGETIINQEYTLEGVITLNSFLKKYNLEAFIKDEYQEEELEEIYNYLNEKFNKDDNYKLENLMVADMSLNANWLNDKGTRNYYIMAKEATRAIDEEHNKVINNVYGNEIGSIYNYRDIKYNDILIPNDYLKKVKGNLDIVITGDTENPQAIYFFNSQEVIGFYYYNVINATYQEGFKVSSLESFLRELGLSDLIKENYTKDEIIEIYDYINSLELYR